jgi:hypothetical protein
MSTTQAIGPDKIALHEHHTFISVLLRHHISLSRLLKSCHALASPVPRDLPHPPVWRSIRRAARQKVIIILTISLGRLKSFPA